MTIALDTKPHEIVETFDSCNMPLSETLIEMLNEDYTHQTERRGCGYTQATRALATHINLKRDPENLDDLRLFERSLRGLKLIINQDSAEHIQLKTWRNLDLRQDLINLLANPTITARNPSFYSALQEEIHFQHHLRHSTDLLKREESRILIQLLIDIILPYQDDDSSALISLPEKSKVGSCTLAEKFFLEIAYGSIPRKGRVNVIVDEQNRPLLIEKLNMGDSHSCISVAPVVMNGVRLPAGSLFAVEYADELQTGQKCKKLNGQIIPLAACTGFRFLRLTTLCVSPTNRERAFSTHFAWQSAAGLFSHHSTEISQLLTVAQAQL